ncbi:MAG: helix-turn-helix domain-containing protein [Alphaproteobacteria bacterium]|nr:helix-turn-helix domain-containing protein [Alphaproteobacteria bacterium]
MLRAALMTIAEVAEMLKVTPRTVGGWIRSGDLRAVKAGKDWRIAQVDLEAFLNAHANRPPRAAERQADDQRSAVKADTKPADGKGDGNGHGKIVGLEAWRTDKAPHKNGGSGPDGGNGSTPRN